MSDTTKNVVLLGCSRESLKDGGVVVPWITVYEPCWDSMTGMTGMTAESEPVNERLCVRCSAVSTSKATVELGLRWSDVHTEKGRTVLGNCLRPFSDILRPGRSVLAYLGVQAVTE